MPDFVPPQLCKSTSRSPSADGWLHEIKFDGYRIQMRVEDGDVSLKTRTGLDWTDKFPAIATAAAKLSDAIIDGEIVALSKTGDPDFSELQTALVRSKYWSEACPYSKLRKPKKSWSFSGIQSFE